MDASNTIASYIDFVARAMKIWRDFPVELIFDKKHALSDHLPVIACEIVTWNILNRRYINI